MASLVGTTFLASTERSFLRVECDATVTGVSLGGYVTLTAREPRFYLFGARVPRLMFRAALRAYLAFARPATGDDTQADGAAAETSEVTSWHS